MEAFITFTVITSMSPEIDFLDSVTFSSTVNHFITFVLCVVWLSRLCTMRYCFPHSDAFFYRCQSTLNPIGPPQDTPRIQNCHLVALEGCEGLISWHKKHICFLLCFPHLRSIGALGTISFALFVEFYIRFVNL